LQEITFMKKYTTLALIFFSFALSGCATYHITPESLRQQLSGGEPSRMLLVKGNGLQKIKVLDKNEHEKDMRVTIHTSVRIFKNDGKKVTFYFNTLEMNDSAISGSFSSIIKMKVKPVPISEIKKIELQVH